VTVFVEAVRRSGKVVDQFGEGIEALRFLGAGEELGQGVGRADAGQGQLTRLAHDRVGSAQRRAGFFAGGAERLQRHGRGG
jgi:hypothetical protein